MTISQAIVLESFNCVFSFFKATPTSVCIVCQLKKKEIDIYIALSGPLTP